MIKNSYLRKIVEKSGRREITSSMVERAEEDRRQSYYQLYSQDLNYQNQLMAAQQSSYGNSCGQYFGQSLLDCLGGIGSIGTRCIPPKYCPYCGRRL